MPFNRANPISLSHRLTRRNWLAIAGVTTSGYAFAQPPANSGEVTATDEEAVSSSPPRLTYESPQVQNWRIGLILDTPVTCTGVLATFVVPMDWPEQKVSVIGRSIDRNIAWETRELPVGARQVVLRMPRVTAGSTVEISFDFAVERSLIMPPEKTDDLTIPTRPDRDLRMYMGVSPNIDTNNSHIKMVARELADREAENDWQRIEQIYDYVVDNIEYVEGPIRNASDALKDGKGDCEDKTSLFVALCRNNGIPARMVWIPDHCYPEFYLETPDGDGVWFPCQAAGTRQFGRMAEYRPVLQKGDRFKVPESRSQVRYVSEFFQCLPQGKGKPRPKFIRELIDV